MLQKKEKSQKGYVDVLASRTNLIFVKQCLMLTNHGILHYLWSSELSKNFSQLIVSTIIFSQYFLFNRFKCVGYPAFIIS